MTEKQITNDILKLLKSLGIWAFKHWSGPMSSPGIADILGIYEGKFLAIEVKGPRGIVSQEQDAFIANVQEAGGIGFVAWSVDDVIDELNLSDRVMF